MFSEQKRNPSAAPRPSVLPTATVLGALFTWAILSQAPINGGWGDVAIVGVYALGYALAIAILAGILRALTSAVTGRVGRGAWLVDALPLALLGGLSAAWLTPLLARGSVMGPAVGAATGGILLGLGALVRGRRRRLPGRLLSSVGAAILLSIVLLPRLAFLQGQPPLSLSGVEVPPTPYSVRLLGLDGVDLRQVEAFMAQGIPLPNFARMIQEGASGPLETLSPHSPVVWTSMATGRAPEDHGVLTYTAAFFRPAGLAVPYLSADLLGNGLDALFDLREVGGIGSNERQVKAIWEILADLGRPGLMLNWWASFPAEHVGDGAIVSNHIIPWDTLSAESLEALRDTPDLVYPQSLQDEAIDIAAGIARERDLGALKRDAFSAAGWEYYKARDDMVWALYDHLYRPDYALSTPYFQGVDTASHAYTTLVFGPNINKRRPVQIPEAEAAQWWQTLVVESYLRMDQRLGAFLDGRSEQECIVVVSDHGWRYDGTSHWNQPPGIFLAVGAPFKAGARVEDAHVLDILPTLAQVLGLPLSAELEGAPIKGAFTQGFLAQTPPVTIPTYGARRQALVDVPAPVDDGHIERLRALGYVD